MKLFLTRLLLFSVPAWVYVLFVYCTDPYDFLAGPRLISDAVKMRTAYPLNYCLWEMPLFARHPSPYALFGDSRMAAVKPEHIKAVTGQEYFNMAFGGATLREIVSSFWFADRHVRLQKVYIGLNFNLYTDYEQMDRTAEVLVIERTPAAYFINRTVLLASLYGIAGQWLNFDPKIGAVTVDRETFWRTQLEETTKGFYSRHVYPQKYHGELERIAARVKERGGKLVFIIFPTHIDLQNRIKDFGLEGELARFKRDLVALAPTYDFDVPSALTTNKDNFSDPYHCREACIDEVIRDVWKQ